MSESKLIKRLFNIFNPKAFKGSSVFHTISPFDQGLVVDHAGMREIIKDNIKLTEEDLDVDIDFFEDSSLMERIAFVSGGDLYILVGILYDAILHTEVLPIDVQTLRNAIGNSKVFYDRSIEAEYWEPLIKVHKTKKIPDPTLEKNKYFMQYLVKYTAIDSQGEQITCYEVLPIIQELPSFRKAMLKS